MLGRVFIFGLLGLIIGGAAAFAGEQVLESFYYPSDQEAGQAWKPAPDAPPARQTAGGTAFPVPFRKPIDRVYWDKAVSWNLDPHSSLEVDLTCDNPEAVRSLALYFKSGNGWYIWNKPLRRTGRQTLTILKQDFRTEGNPAGWDRITALRVSPWKNADLDTTLVFHTLIARTDGLMIVRGTASTRDAAARTASAKVTRRLSEWMSEMGIGHGIIDDEDVEAGALKRVRLAILPYNPFPSAKELAALRVFLQGGGKLIVFYSASPDLAAAMRMKLGPYMRADRRGVWSSFSFVDTKTWQVPRRVFQESPNILPVYPDDRTARVIAWWENAEGKRTEYPAWVASEQGLWMSHILMNDDRRDKSDMLLGLLAHYNPAIWPAAARRCLEQAGRIDSFRSFDDAVASLSRQADNARSPAAVRRAIAQSRRLFEEMRALYQSGLFPQVVAQSRTLRDQLIEAYSLVQRPAPGEVRGAWDHDGTGWFPGHWEKTCRVLAEHGINALFPNMVWGGLSHVPGRHLPLSHTGQSQGDPLTPCIRAARKYGLEVHVWMVCWKLDNAPPDFVEKMKKQGRLQMTADGETVPWLNPAHPENVKLAVNALVEIAQNYEIDGIHLDYVRFPDSRHDFSPVTRRAFESHMGRRIGDWPAAVRNGGPLADSFKRWRADQITQFVKTVRDRVKAVNPRIRISAAVYGQYPGCIDGVGQDWADWIRKGYVDFVCPMNYTVDAGEFASLTRKQIGFAGRASAILPGIGVTADESQLGPDQVIEQIAALRKLGSPGFVLFDLSSTLLRETLPALSMGATAPSPAK